MTAPDPARLHQSIRQLEGDGGPVDVEQLRVETTSNGLDCVTQDPNEPAPTRYLAVCTKTAALVSTSRYCPDQECGGHPVCRPCYQLGVTEGLIR